MIVVSFHYINIFIEKNNQNKHLQNKKDNHHSCTVSGPLHLKLRRRRLFYGGGDHLECLINTKKDENVISGIAFISYAQSQKIEIPNNLKSL